MLNSRVSAGVTGGLLAVSLVLTACGGSNAAAPANRAPSVSSSAPATAQHNGADVAFAQSMIPHHRDAVVMAELAADRAQDPAVKTLAEQIQAAQQPEIDQLTGFLSAWGAEVSPSNSMDGMGHGSTPITSSPSGMGGMMSPAQMEQLRNATGGAQFDEMFLTMMIEHHRSAVSAAQEEIEQGSNPDAKQLAEKIVADQTAEISRMQQMQAG